MGMQKEMLIQKLKPKGPHYMLCVAGDMRKSALVRWKPPARFNVNMEIATEELLVTEAKRN